MELEPNQQTTFGVTFAPSAPGSIAAAISIRLEGATKDIAKVTLMGEGAAPTKKVGSGCAISQGAGASAMPLLMFGVVTLGLWLRRRQKR